MFPKGHEYLYRAIYDFVLLFTVMWVCLFTCLGVYCGNVKMRLNFVENVHELIIKITKLETVSITVPLQNRQHVQHSQCCQQ